MDIALAGLREKYSILDEYVLLCPGPDARVCPPPTRSYSMYRELLKSGICFFPHPLVVEALRERIYVLFGHCYFGVLNKWRTESLSSDFFPYVPLLLKRKHACIYAPGELMNSKNVMMRKCNMNCQRVYELEWELEELKSNFALLGNRCQLAKSFHDAKERELADIASKVPSLEKVEDDKERDLQKKLLKHAGLERVLGLVINKEGCLNPYLLKGVYERFIRTTHMRTLFICWMLIVVQKVVQDLI
ncbi:hypothetical protein M9H77_23394 [Catharanthus roseus]|uniref:Uncharacterized protein n=1 Tax=Catharanthus roseus TaxID=4058 RepID=A0ACC0ATW6_CATRO|nr:hypothetical protein M9H77_23394 [Catharanthus roseus]